MRIPWVKARKRLTILWFLGAGLIFLTLLLQTFLDRYGENVVDVWGWFFPTVLPTLSLIISVFVMDTLGRGIKISTVDKFFFWLSFTLSLFYLFSVFSVIFMEPFSRLSAFTIMNQSNLWLGPFQGLVSASLGAFFIQGNGE